MGKKAYPKYNPEQLTLWERSFFPEIFKGLLVTGKVLFENVFGWAFKGRAGDTVFYPEEMRPDFTPINRGKHILVTRKDGTPKCVACMMCATACPARCIDIEATESPNPQVQKMAGKFNIHLDLCIFCGLCVEACPVDAIRMTKEHRMVEYTREDMRVDIKHLMNWRKAYEDEPWVP
jgi:NADH-quinone oxidoreductase subunit I